MAASQISDTQPGGGNSTEQVVFHPYIFALTSVLFFYSYNVHYYHFSALVRPLLIVFGLTLFTWYLLSRFMSSKRAGLLLGFFLLVFFSHGYVHDVAEIRGHQLVTDTLSWLEVKYFGPYFLVLIGGTWFLATRKNLYVWTYVMNTAAFFVLLPVLIQLGPIAFKQTTAFFRGEGELPLDARPTPASEVRRKPDIYFIILDSYGREDVLRDFYGFDNSDFIGYLKKRGFWLSDSSVANYTFTALSVSSTLNYAYYDKATRDEFSGLLDWYVPRRLVRNNRVMRFLKDLGYSIVVLNSQHETLNKQDADVFLGKWWFVNPFELGLIERTPLPWMLRKLGWPILQNWHRSMSQYSLDALPTAASMESPKFVFAHVLLPHPPLVFGPRGEEVNLARRYDWKGGLAFLLTPGATAEEFRDGYRDQVEYVSRMVPAIIEQILTKSESPPIIILQSDHGPPGIPQVTGTDEIVWRAGFGILNAMYLPYGGEQAVYEGISPVNTFRAVFNHYFGSQYPLLEDLHYMATPMTPFKQERFVVEGLEVRKAEEATSAARKPEHSLPAADSLP